MIHDFTQKLDYSIGAAAEVDMHALKQFIVGAQDVRIATRTEQAIGIDYVVTLRRGAMINIDAKTREKGASRYWFYGEPELALEIYSIWNGDKYPDAINKTGWTLSEQAHSDYIYYTFHPDDTDIACLLPFQLLRCAFHRNYWGWRAKYKEKSQETHRGYHRWQSLAVFVPLSVVTQAIQEEMIIQ